MCEASGTATAIGTKRRAGVLCFRRIEDRFEFLLISRRSRRCCDGYGSGGGGAVTTGDGSQDAAVGVPLDDTYTIPAGKFESDSDISCEDCALREAREEAGIECKVVQDIGWIPSRSKYDQPVNTRYFLCLCLRMLETWLEDGARERLWFSPEEALRRVSYREDLSCVVRSGIQALLRLPPLPKQGPDLIAPAAASGAGAVGGGAAPDEAAEVAEMSPMSCATDASSEVGGEERYICYSHQVGGHFCMVKPAPGTRLEVELPMQEQPNGRGNRSAENCIVHGAKVILKPFNADEERFYCRLSRGALSALLPFAPLFYGTKQLRREQIETLAGSGSGGSGGAAGRIPGQSSMGQGPDEVDKQYGSQNLRRYLVLEDLGCSSAKPCFLDLKVGCRQRAARHSAQKRAHMAAKAAQSTSAILGFRICGMQCYSPETGTLQRYDKYWGQRIKVDTMQETLAMFFVAGRNLIRLVADQLERLEAVVRQLRGCRFWGSSLLVFFDAALLQDASEEEFLSSVRLKIIDFANFENVGGDRADDEYLCGISNVRAHLQALLEGDGLDPPLERRLAPPPPADEQDSEQEHAWQSLQRRKVSSALSKSERNTGATHEEEDTADNFAASAQTISGATGRTLLRELASHTLMTVESEAEIKSRPGLADLFA